MAQQRLHKFLASAGVGSRRQCETLIAEGHVTVDGVEVRSMGVLVDPEHQEIRFHDEKVTAEVPVHYALWKPPGYICTNRDDHGRRTVVSLIKDAKRRRLYTVGRLDEDSEGLILVTNDGPFAHRMAHPSHGVEKTYVLRLRGSLEPDELTKAREGLWLSTGRTRPMFIKIIKRTRSLTQVLVVIREGQNRVLRRIFAKLGHPVLRLKRTRVGGISLQGLRRGECRRLRPAEVEDLESRCSAEEASPEKRKRSSKRPSGRPAQRSSRRPSQRSSKRPSQRSSKRSPRRPRGR